jgi:hypothetical protein
MVLSIRKGKYGLVESSVRRDVGTHEKSERLRGNKPMVRVYSEESKRKMQAERDEIDKICPCPCGMVHRASECGIYDRWERGVFGDKGSGCLQLDFHRMYLYRKAHSAKKV